MTHCDSLASISDDELFATVQHLTARSNVALAALLSHLGEVERRGVHRLRACASLYAYCIYELRMSEDGVYRRSKAARLVREYPELCDAIAKENSAVFGNWVGVCFLKGKTGRLDG